jgi:transcription antitermination factor NusG
MTGLAPLSKTELSGFSTMITTVSDVRKPSSETVDIAQRLPLGDGERWYVARTLPFRENSAQFNIQRLGFETYVPRVQRTVRHARKLRNVLAPLFSSYVFVILDLSRDRWRSVNGATGVASLIMGAEQPIPAPRGVVEALVAMREGSGAVSFHQDLAIGQMVRILSGPFAQAICRLDRLDDRGRVCVLLEIMGGHITACLDRSALGPAVRQSQ